MQLQVHETPTSALARVAQKIQLRTRYDNFIGGTWLAPAKGQYFESKSPIRGQVICECARSTAEDV